MIPKGLFSQIMIILLSLGIIFTYVKPEFDVIAKTQDEILIYKTEHEKVSSVNVRLAQLVSAIENISSADQRSLLTYMPDTVDTVGVPRDINFIAEAAGVLLTAVHYEGAVEVSPSTMDTSSFAGTPQAQVFSMEFEGSYDQIKEILQAFEENNYPIEVHELTISKTQGGFLAVRMEVVAYNRFIPTPISFDGVVQ